MNVLQQSAVVLLLTSSRLYCKSFIISRLFVPGIKKTKAIGNPISSLSSFWRGSKTLVNKRMSSTDATSSSSSTQNENENIVRVSDAFDGGNGEYVKMEGSTVYVKIKPDIFTELEQTYHKQHFYFRAFYCPTTQEEEKSIEYAVINAGETSYAKAWKESTTFYSTTPHDPFSWKRLINTSYNESDGTLRWNYTHTLTKSIVYFAYFPPYSYERHLGLISKCQAVSSKKCTVISLGKSLDGREIECVKVGSGSKICWLIHRQHPGENMAEYFAEGVLTRLLGLDTCESVDGIAALALKSYTFYIVPNMNPDGALRGHLRTNACGANLNREWASSTYKKKGGGEEEEEEEIFYEAPSLNNSPEVYHVLKKMDETGVDAFLDVHGDEVLPYNFLAGSEGCSNWSMRLKALHGAFLASYERANTDMQRHISYEPEQIGKARTNICSNQIAIRYDCFSATLEMPFKDCLSNSDPERGWNPARAMMLGKSVLDPLIYIHPHLRDYESQFWNNFPKQDEYISPSSNYK